MSDEHKSDDFSWTTKWIIVGGAAAAVAVVGAYFAFKYRKEHFTGVGRKQYADGSVYEGEMVDGRAHGRGRLVSGPLKGLASNVVVGGEGAVLVGEFFEDCLNGEMVCEYDRGLKFVGSIKSDRIPGSSKDVSPFSTDFISDGTLLFEAENMMMKVKGRFDSKGNMSDGKVVISSIDDPDSVVYSGSMTNGLFHGQDCFRRLADGSYRGDFVMGVMEGFGRLESKAGVYEGQFKADKKHGQGKMTFADGSVFTGSWRDGVWEDGMISFPNKPSRTIVSGKVVG